MTSSSRGSWALLLVVLWVLQQIRDSQVPFFLGWKAPVREGSTPVCSLRVEVRGVTSSLWGWMSGLLPQAQKFRDV